MAYFVEITERGLPRERQAALTDLLVRELHVEREEAELTALVMPAEIGPFGSSTERDAFLVALAEGGFAARPMSAPSAPVHAAPAAVPVVAPAPAAAPAYSAPVYTGAPEPAARPAPAAAPAAPPPYGPVGERSGNGVAIAIAVALAVLAAVLGAVVLTQNRQAETTTAAEDPPPGGYPSAGEPAPAEALSETSTGDADFAQGFSPGRGVNWDVFTQSAVTRYADAPEATPIPVRDAPSARHGSAIGEIPPGEAVETSGCLPRRPEGGRWCTLAGTTDQWIYDRYLVSSPPPAPRASSGGSGGVQVVRYSDGQVGLTLSQGGQTWRMPRRLSAGTSVGNVERVTLAGRSVVRFTAQDARWSTTYYWEYRQGLLHFVGTDGNRTNVSEAPGSQAIISADQGYVPSDDVQRGNSNASRAPSRTARAPRGQNVPNIIVMGSYSPYDQAGLNARYAQAQRTGLTLQVVPASTYGMNGDYQVIVAGPYDYDTAVRLLDQVRGYVPDAFRKALD